jgi:ribonuclease Z
MYPFSIYAAEIDSDTMTVKEYRCQDQFLPGSAPLTQPFDRILLSEPSLTVSGVILDHSIPCLGFTLKEQFHINIIKDAVLDMGLDIGPWIRSFKQAIFNGQDPASLFEVGTKTDIRPRQFALGELAERIATVTPGQKISYIADVGYSESNVSAIIEFVKHADHLFIEAAFLDAEKETAQKKYHLTARQAGMIAASAHVRQFTVFHFSPRYTGKEHLLREEALDAFRRHSG